MDSVVSIGDKQYRCVTEGLAHILSPQPTDGQEVKKTKTGGEEQSVFHNPIQTFNRDLSVLAAKVHAEHVLAAKLTHQSKKKPRNKSEKQPTVKRKRDDGPEDASAQNQHNPKKARTDEPSILAALHANSQPEIPSENTAHGQSATQPEGNSAEPSGDEPNSNNQETQTPTKPSHKQYRILDALSATGLRALRYAKEIPEATLVTANDLAAEAVVSIKRNVKYNNVQDRVFPLQGNASGHMYHIGNAVTPKMPDGTQGKYDLIDLDPYGTAAPFLDSAVQAISDGGMLAVTCTDSATFASVGYLEKTFALYGGIPWKGSHSHEAGLRLIIHAVATSAARYGLSVEPLLSLSIDYYVRIFIRVRKSPAEVKLLPSKTMIAYNCDTGCGAWTTQQHARTQTRENKNGSKIYHFSAAQGPTASPECEHCGFKTHVAGPMWGGYLHNPHFVQAILDKLDDVDPDIYTTITRMRGMLNTALHETLHVAAAESSTKEGTDPADVAKANGGTEAEGARANAGPARLAIEPLDPALVDAHPFFLLPAELARTLRTQCPSEAELRGAFIGLGYQVSRSHTKPGSIRTDAPWSVIWEIMRAWVHQKEPQKANSLKEGTAGFGIWKAEQPEAVTRMEKSVLDFLGKGKKGRAALAMLKAMKENEDDNEADPDAKELIPDDAGGAVETGEIARDGHEPSGSAKEVRQQCLATAANGKKMPVIFDLHLGRDRDKGKFVLYQVNPRKNWGPQSRAK